MAENPVLKEAKERGIVSPVSRGASAPTVSSANPVIREYSGEAVRKRSEAQGRIVSTGREQTASPSVSGEASGKGGFDLGEFLVGTLSKGANSIAKAGSSTLAFAERALLEPFFPGVTENSPIQKLNENISREGEQLQEKYRENVAAGGKAAQIAEQIGVGTIAAVPQAVVAMGTAGASLGAQGLSAAAQASPTIVNTLRTGATKMAKNPNFWTSFLTTVGNNYESAKADGAGEVKAGLYALADSLMGSAVEVGGGIQTLPDALRGSRFTVHQWIDAMVEEGKEEVVQGIISRGLENVMYGKGNALASVTEENAVFNPVTAAKEFGMGAAVGGILGGAQGLASNAIQDRQNHTGNSAGTPSVSAEGSFTPGQKAAGEGKKTAPEVGAARVNYDPMEAAAIRYEGKTFRNVVAGFDTKVSDFFSKWRGGRVSQNGEKLEKLYLGKMPDAVRKQVSTILGYAVDKRDFIVTNDDVKHVFDHHGNADAEIQRGNIPLEQWMLDALPEIVTAPDSVVPGNIGEGKKNAGKQAVVFSKTFPGGTVVTVQFDNKGRGTMELNTLYAQKNKGTTSKLDTAAEAAPNSTSETLEPVPSGNSVSQNTTGVNVENDALMQAIFGGKRVDHRKANGVQFDALAERGDVGVDAALKLFHIDPEQHIDRRSMEGVGDRKVNAFQFDHPQLHPYYQKAANALIADADISLQFPVVRSYERTVQGNRVNQRVQASEHLRMAMKETGLSRREIMDAAERIVNDHGQENVKAAKQVEIILDYMLTNGWTTMAGESVEPNARYIAEKNAIAGSLPQVDDAGLDGIGAADAGSVNSAYDNLQARSEHFHPEGANVAEGRHVDVPTTDFAGRNIPRSASNLMGAQGTPDAAVVQMEQEIASGKLSFDTITDTDAVSRARKTMEEKGFEGALEQYRQAVGNNAATKDNTCLGQQLLLTAMRSGNETATAEILSLYTRNSTTAAQAMQAQSIFRKLSPEGQLVAMQKAVDALNGKYGTDAKLDPADVADFMNAKTTEERKQVEERMVMKAARAVPGTFRAKFDTVRYLAMLGNPRTHIRNILGNTLFQAPVAVKNRLGAAAEMVANALSGGRVERTKSLFGANPMGRLAAEARADWVNARDFLTQSSKYNDNATSLRGIEREAHAFSDGNVAGRSINAAADLNRRALEAEDTAAKRWIYTQSLAGYLKANGCKSLAEADPALLNRARNYAAQEALRNTFNDKNTVSDAVSRLGGLSSSDNRAVQAAGYVVEGVLPFKRTPANIAVRAVEYSPVGAVLGAIDTARSAWNGDMAQVSTGIDRVAAGLTGTALLYAGFLAAGAGYVTGGEDEDENQREFNDLTGHQDYALELKDGTSVTLDWLAPEAIPFFMGVELYEQSLDGGEIGWAEISDMVKNASAPMLEMSMLQGLNDTFENAAYAKNRDESVMGALVTSALTNYFTQVFPTVGGQIERSTEDVRMTTYTDKNKALPPDLQYTLGKVSQKVPGWEYQQIPYIDAWGRTEATGDPLQRSVNNLFNPAYISQVEVDKVESELQRLADATGRTTIFPDRAERQITVGGEKQDLTAEQYVKYATAKGQNSYSLVRSAMESDAYRRMGDGEKAEFLAAMYGYAGYKAKRQMFPAYTDTAYTKYDEAEAKGITPVEFYAYKESTGDLTADKDASGKSISGSKKEKVVAAIDAMDLTPMEKDWLYLLNGYTAKDMADLPWKR